MKPTISEIWQILKKATRGKMAVYDLACCMYGLDKNTILDIADKIHNDLYLDKWNWRKLAKIRINNEKLDKCRI